MLWLMPPRQPEPQVRAFFVQLLPSEADRLAEQGGRALSENDLDTARDRFRARLDAEPAEVLDGARLARLVDGGFLVLDNEGLRATPAGLRRLDGVLGALLR